MGLAILTYDNLMPYGLSITKIRERLIDGTREKIRRFLKMA